MRLMRTRSDVNLDHEKGKRYDGDHSEAVAFIVKFHQFD